MNIIFQIEFKYENSYVLGRLLNSKEVSELKVHLKLDAINIKTIVPADSISNGENLRADLFVFRLKNNSAFKSLTVGKIVQVV